MKIKTVKWLDSCSSDSWQEVGRNEKKPLTIISCGYVVEETKEYLSLSHSVTADGKQHAGFISIPKSCIIK